MEVKVGTQSWSRCREWSVQPQMRCLNHIPPEGSGTIARGKSLRARNQGGQEQTVPSSHGGATAVLSSQQCGRLHKICIRSNRQRSSMKGVVVVKPSPTPN